MCVWMKRVNITPSTRQASRLFVAGTLCAALCLFVTCASAKQDGQAPEANQPPRQVQPILDTPLRDPAICRGPDGIYYLTGTSATIGRDGKPDFQNNDGIYLWKSTDMAKWDAMGKVWNLAEDAKSRWTRMKGVNLDDPTGDLVRGVRSPELHYLKGTWWIPFSMSHGGTGLLKSMSGKAEGPYQYVGLMTVRGMDPSLFEDVDGSVYWVFGEGWIARMKDDLSDLAEQPRLLQPEGETYELWGEGAAKFAENRPLIGTHGAFIFRENNEYHLCAAEYVERLGGKGVHDTFVASAKSLSGPFGKRRLMIPHGGQTTVFRDGEGNLHGTFGGDRMAVFTDKAGVVPLRYDGFLKHVWKPNLVSATSHPLKHLAHQAVVVEGGVVPGLRPLDLPGPFENSLRDPTVLNAPDGWYYMVATTAHTKMPNPDQPGIYGWKSRDLKTWEAMGELWNVADWKTAGSPYKPQPPHFAPQLKQNFEGIWSPGIYYVKGNYYIVWGPSYGGCYLLRSKTGKAEGPYESVDCEFHKTGIAPALFADDDGSVYYVCTGGISIGKMKDDMSGLAEPLRDCGPADGSYLGFEGPALIKAHGKYILLLANTGKIHRQGQTASHDQFGTYDWMYCWADNIYGPYSTAKVAVPHAGETNPFLGKDGRWYNAIFGSDSTAPFYGKFNIFPLDIRWNNGEIAIEPEKLKP